MSVKVLEDVAAVSVGESHSAAIKRDGSLWLWGHNYLGQIGDGMTNDRNMPKEIMGDVSQLSLGYNHSTALTRDGVLYISENPWYRPHSCD